MAAGLVGDRVLLRALTQADLEPLRAFVNCPEVVRESNAYRPISEPQHAAWFARAVVDPDASWFAIDDVRAAPPRLVGNCCLVGIDWAARQGELRVRVGNPADWGQGFGREACRLLVDYGFEDLNLERIWLRVYAENLRAQRVYDRLGFVVEGRLRRGGWSHGAPADVVLMGLLRDEWRAARAAIPAAGAAS